MNYDYTEEASDILTTEDSYVENLLSAVKRRAMGEEIDINKLADHLFESAYMSAVQRSKVPEGLNGH